MTQITKADSMAKLRQRSSEKWRSFPEEILPMFVAEMDYPLAPAIKSALNKAIELNDTGYVSATDTTAALALAEFTKDSWGWEPKVEQIRTTTDVSVVIVEALRGLIQAGDRVIINPPIYPPFFDLIPEAGGEAVQVPLLDDGKSYSLDLEGIDRALAAGAKGVLLCNPHNPLGLVHSKETLTELSRIVAKHNGFVVSDEIHAPLTHSTHTFTPYLSVSEEAKQHGISAISGSKAFNLAGLKCAFFVTDSEPMAKLVAGFPEEVFFRTGLFGLIATREGFANSRDWLSATLASIESNFELLRTELKAKLPEVRLRSCGASYLAWLDFRALNYGDDPAKIILEKANVALSNGPMFGQEGKGYTRINLACAPETIIEAIDRISKIRL